MRYDFKASKGKNLIIFTIYLCHASIQYVASFTLNFTKIYSVKVLENNIKAKFYCFLNTKSSKGHM